MTRVPLIVGNWKMHKTGREARAFIASLAPQLFDADRRVYLAVPFTAIAEAAELADTTRIVIGAQNMNDHEEGAFTGEVSARMLKEAGARFVLLGHSERRHQFGETNALIQRKLRRAFMEKLTPILCVGETLAEREEQITQRVLSLQLEECLDGFDEESIAEMYIAYEPVWAIGTGRTATSAIAQEVHREIRQFLLHRFGKKAAERVCLLYGGSVNAENSKQLMAEKDIDGVLVGGASLDPAAFVQIINH